jgi:hypothetical protein
MADGMTLDTGALIALERKGKAMRRRMTLAFMQRLPVTVPAAVLAEWWRDGPRQRTILSGFIVEPTTERIAKIAGTACRTCPDATAVDAIVMASAAMRGDVVFTSDMEDLQGLQAVFPNVRLFRATGS